MNKLFSLLLTLSIVLQLHSQTTKNVLNTAGYLEGSITTLEKTTVTRLVITGTLDARDFKFMRDDMLVLDSVDISLATISAYSGGLGTDPYVTSYSANIIPDKAFMNKTSLTHIELPLNTVSVQKFAFYQTSLEAISLPENITSIENFGFSQTNLTEILLPLNITTLKENAFSGNLIEQVYIPASVTYLDNVAFRGVTLFDVAEDNPLYASEDGVLFNKDKTKLIRCPTSKEGVYVVPTTVDTINAGGFENCVSLTDIILPSTLSSIGMAAFYNCVALKIIELPSGLTEVKDALFEVCDSLHTVYIPESVSSYGSSPFDCYAVRDVFLFSSTPVSISTGVFTTEVYNNATLHVPIGSKTLYQANAVWSKFSSIVEFDTNTISLPSNSVKTVSTTAGNLSKILSEVESVITKDLTINGVIDVRDFFFMRDSMPTLESLDLENVSIADFTGAIDTTLFRSTSTVSYFPANALPQTAFKNKESLKYIKLPSTLTAIDDEAFMGCVSLDSIELFNTTPIDIFSKEDVFLNVDKESCKLLVPEGSELTYRVASIWEDFYMINDNQAVSLSLVLSKEALSVYPNPVQDKFVVKGLKEQAHVKMLDMQGKIVLQKQMDVQEEISADNLPSGVYLLVVYTDKKIETLKLVIK